MNHGTHGLSGYLAYNETKALEEIERRKAKAKELESFVKAAALIGKGGKKFVAGILLGGVIAWAIKK